jgi:branched-chain amino acid transport system ATP-binding protein
MTGDEAILDIEGLRVRHGAVVAVRDLDLSVGRGEVVGLIGPNGAGKTTTLSAIMGLVSAAAGDVRLRGRSIVGGDTEEIARLGVALVPEGRRIFGDFTVEENLRLGMFCRRAKDGADADLRSVFDLFPDIEEYRRRAAGHLSGGQQQQLAIARALVSSPDVLLLDEPSLGLAPSLVEDLFGALQRIRRSGVTTLLVEQRAQMTVAFADRTHVMRDGRIVLTLSPDDAGDTERLSAAYFGS